MPNNDAYLLIAHGSRDSRVSLALEKLSSLLSVKLATLNHTNLVGVAYLEFAPLPLHQQICQFAQQAQRQGANHLKLIPLFLLPGVHVIEDLPREVAIAQTLLSHELTIELKTDVGGSPQMLSLLEKRFAQLPNHQHRILLAHGSSRPMANQIIETLASDCNAFTAYWSLNPQLGERLAQLVESGSESIAILPYFLFVGGLGKLITEQVESFKCTYAPTPIQLAPPLGATPELAELILALTAEASRSPEGE